MAQVCIGAYKCTGVCVCRCRCKCKCECIALWIECCTHCIQVCIGVGVRVGVCRCAQVDSDVCSKDPYGTYYWGPTGVCEKSTPPEIHKHWNISFQSTKSGAG